MTTASTGQRLILRRLLAGADPVCIDCRRPLEPGEPRVTVRGDSPAAHTLLRCTDCEYRAVRG